jgi:nicotinate phosphoribosyltransferase
MHPTIVPAIERAACLGGCDGDAGALDTEKVGIPATGTLPHALALIPGSTAVAAKGLDETMDPEANHTILIDTFDDELKGYLAAPDDVAAGRPSWRGESYGRGQRKWNIGLRAAHGVRWYLHPDPSTTRNREQPVARKTA